MTYSKHELTACLTGKFNFQQEEGSNYEKYRLEIGGQYVAHTVLSRGWTDVSAPMLSAIARQLGVTTPELRSMIDCQMDAVGYLTAVFDRR